MFKACLAQSLRAIPSSSRATVSSIHSSAILLAASRRKSQARTSKKLNTARREERQRLVEANRPHVVLGTRPGEDVTWDNCDLAKVLIDEGDLVNNTEPQLIKHSAGTISLPKYLGYGVGEAEKTMLFENLPALSAEADILQEDFPVDGNEAWLVQRHSEAEKRELGKANNFAKVLDLRNANAGGIAYENRRRIITEFSGPDNPFDTGRPEVQAALLTYKIRNLWAHLIKFKRDVANRRSLRKLVHQRAKILKYLKRLDRERYDVALERLALASEAVEGELVV